MTPPAVTQPAPGPLSTRRLVVITSAMMLSLFMASIESTVVATAMPTIVAQLGGMEIYAWVFSAYLLTSTTVVPIFGKLSDIYGRQRIYLISVTLFLVGSILCGVSETMAQLVFFRAVQGLGAGGIQTMAFIIIGDIYTFAQRARMQGLFSGVWGVSSVVGPLAGGLLVEQASWHWVFLVNVPFGLLAAGLMAAAWRDVSPRNPGKVDYAGAALMTGGVVSLLFALFELRTGAGADMGVVTVAFVVALAQLAALFLVEKRAPNPLLPLPLFANRLFSTAIGHGFLAGFALFGSTSFVPLFVQAVLGTSATAAGATLTPMLLGWVTASIIGSRLLLTVSHRTLALSGMTFLVLGFVLLTLVGADTPHWMLVAAVASCGTGMGLSVPSFLIAVQTSVPRASLGAATATVQFSRSIGGAVGVSVMGVILAVGMRSGLVAAGLDPAKVSLATLLETGGAVDATVVQAVRSSVTTGVHGVFVAALCAAVLGWMVTFLAPRGRIGQPAGPVPSTAE